MASQPKNIAALNPPTISPLPILDDEDKWRMMIIDSMRQVESVQAIRNCIDVV